MGLVDRVLGRRQPFYGYTSVPEELRASAVKLEGSSGTANESKQALRRLIQPWQQAALGYYDALGECWYPAQFYGRALSQLRLFVTETKPDGEIVPYEGTDKRVLDVLERVQDPGGGRAEMLRTYGQLRFVTGESYLIVTQDDGDEAWEMVSTDELRINPGSGYTRFRAPQLQPESYADVPDDEYEPLPKGAVVYRFWARHPRYSALADSPVKGVIGLYDLLSRLRGAEIATAQNRAAQAGILFINSDIKWGDAGTQDEDSAQDTFQRNLTASIVAAIRDPGSAAAAAPIVAFVNGEMIKDKQVYDYLRLESEYGDFTDERIDKVIRHISLGLDMPPEVLTGLADTNHWNAWVVEDDTWSSHLHPAAAGFTRDLRTAYASPEWRRLGISNWQALGIGYDAADVINHPDRGRDAQEAYELGTIGPTAYRNARGFSDDDAPSDDELRLMIGWAAKDPTIVLGEDAHAGEGTAQSDVATADAVDEEGAKAANDVQPGPPEQPEEDDALPAAIVASARMAVLRCRELAGSRLITKAKTCDSCAERIKDVPQELVASALTFEAAEDIEAPAPSALVAGGARLFRQALVDDGVSDEWADRLSQMVEMHAARGLYQRTPPALPASFVEAARRAG